jgi:prevent-host-death family protein
MSKQVNLYEAKTHLSRLVDEAAKGAEIVIAKNDKPVARIVPLEKPPRFRKRKLGASKHRFVELKDHSEFYRASPMTSISPTPLQEVNAVLAEMVEHWQNILGSNLIGAYLQGSFAVGDFTESQIPFEIRRQNQNLNGMLTTLL